MSNLYACVEGGACALNHSRQHCLLFCSSDEVSRSWQVAPSLTYFPIDLLLSALVIRNPGDDTLHQAPLRHHGPFRREIDGRAGVPKFCDSYLEKNYRPHF